MSRFYFLKKQRRVQSSQRLLVCVSVIFALAFTAQSQNLSKAKVLQRRDAINRVHGPREAGNGFYRVVIEDFIGAGVGLYSVRTGPLHPINEKFDNKPQDLLAGAKNHQTGTSYTTVRSYTSHIDYVQTDLADSSEGFKTVWLDSLFINEDEVVTDFIEPIGTTGFRVKYKVPGLRRTNNTRVIPDSLLITQTVNVHGRSFNDSWVEITTAVTNLDTTPVTIGIRYLWDLNVAGDDGPVVVQKSGDPFGPNEAALEQLDFAFSVASANDSVAVSPPAYEVFSSVITPANLKRAQFLPSRMQQVFWPFAFFKAFDYQIDENLNVTSGEITGGDVALQYFWERAGNRTITLSRGQTFEATQTLFAGLPNRTPTALADWDPPLCDLTGIRQGPPRTIEVLVQDFASGMGSIRVLEAENVNVNVPDFEIGTIAPVLVAAEVIDQSKPGIFILEARDLCGRTLQCDPIFLTMRPELRSSYHLEPILADRYFYLNNHGLERISVNLNGQTFTLSTDIPERMRDANWFAMPKHGEISIDIARYLKAEDNLMTLTFAGPSGSYADLIVSDMIVKDEVDFVLDLGSPPQRFALLQNLPNPFYGSTKIRFDLPAADHPAHRVELRVYNLLGQKVRTLIAGELPASSYLIEWDGRDDRGRETSAGVYFYKLTAGNVQFTKKMARVR